MKNILQEVLLEQKTENFTYGLILHYSMAFACAVLTKVVASLMP
jgi:hypothetical protein